MGLDDNLDSYDDEWFEDEYFDGDDLDDDLLYELHATELDDELDEENEE